MTSIYPVITWCVGSYHYVIENKLQYHMPLFLALMLNNYIKKNREPYANLVNEWYNRLDAIDRREIKITALN